MSSITTETKIIFSVTLFDQDDRPCAGPVEREDEASAEDCARDLVSYNVHMHKEYYYAKIEKQIVPVYE